MTLDEKISENMASIKKAVTDFCNEYRWINDKEFCVWINYYNLQEFIDELNKIIRIEPSNSECDAQIQDNCLCIVLNKSIIDECGYYDLEEMFPKE